MIVHTQPAPPSRPLPTEVTDPMMQLLGFGVYFAGAIFVVAILAAAGLLWWVFWLGNPTTSVVRKIAWVIGSAIAVGSAGQIAGFVLS